MVLVAQSSKWTISTPKFLDVQAMIGYAAGDSRVLASNRGDVQITERKVMPWQVEARWKVPGSILCAWRIFFAKSYLCVLKGSSCCGICTFSSMALSGFSLTTSELKVLCSNISGQGHLIWETRMTSRQGPESLGRKVARPRKGWRRWKPWAQLLTEVCS